MWFLLFQENMNLIIVVLTWGIFIATAVCEEESEDEKVDRILSELKFTDWELADYCDGIASKRKEVLLHKQPYVDEIKLIENYGNYLKEQSINFLEIPEDDIPYEQLRNYTLLLKPGDALMNKTDFYKLVTFAKENDHLSRNLRIVHPDDPNETIGKQTFLDLLATSRNLSKLQEIWSNWQEGVSKYFDRFGSNLLLVMEAASRNDAYDGRSYWEMLNEYEDGYQKAETLWTDIEPTYQKLYQFVLKRINNYYGTNFTHIPVYLTGSNFGEDWSNLAEIVFPHQQMYKDAKSAFEGQSIVDIYKLAESCGVAMGFNKLSNKFWLQENFEYEICEQTLLMYPSSKYSEILTCKNVTWNTYMDAHEAVLEANLKGLDFQSLPRRELRYSHFDDAVVSLGTTIAIQNLAFYDFTTESDYINSANATENGLAAKLLVALRILPKLAYYISSDIWRLEELQTPSDDPKTTWWDIRKKYQGLQSVSGAETDFLNDPYITSNKPYISKFLGTILQFELLSYSQLVPFFDNENLAEKIGEDSDYRTAILDIPYKSATDILSYHYSISEVNSQHLTEFFQPLEEYMDNAPLVPYPTIPRQWKPKTEAPPEVAITKTETTTAKATNKEETKLEVPVVQNDQQTVNNKQSDSKSDTEPTELAASFTGHSAGMYVLITIGACFFILVAVVVFKKVVKMKRPRTNNRRFEA